MCSCKVSPAWQGLTVTRPIFAKKSTGKRLNPRKAHGNANTNKQKSEKRIENRKAWTKNAVRHIINLYYLLFLTAIFDREPVALSHRMIGGPHPARLYKGVTIPKNAENYMN